MVRPDFARAADLGVAAAAIGETVREATVGDYETALPKLNLSERQVPIRVKLPDAARADLAAIERLGVPGRNGPVMLANVADVSIESGPRRSTGSIAAATSRSRSSSAVAAWASSTRKRSRCRR